MRHLILTAATAAASLLANAQADSIRKPESRFNLHFQTTYIYQYSARFKTPYSGKNSLSGDEEKQNSLTATLYAGARLWKGAEVYINPELAGGSGLSGAVGMGGSSNGETFRVGDPAPTLYLGRLFMSQTFRIGPKRITEEVEDDANALHTFQPKNHLRILLGKWSLGDMFDINAVSNSPRTGFMNWSLMNTGAWDYAANVRGYTYAAGAELSLGNWAGKIAAATLPFEANGATMETDIRRSISLNAGLDHSYKWRGHDGNIRLLGFMNRTHLGSYAQAIDLSRAFNTFPDITSTQKYSRNKTGFAISADQQLTGDLSIFSRIGWNDGKTETWCFTEIDHSAAMGAVLDGKRWKRNDDELGIAAVVNGLSKDHREYLRLGGNGFILGDGTLDYAPEEIAELYYSCKVLKQGLWLSADYQLCLNPGYNHDRGPANIASLRVHVAL